MHGLNDSEKPGPETGVTSETGFSNHTIYQDLTGPSNVFVQGLHLRRMRHLAVCESANIHL